MKEKNRSQSLSQYPVACTAVYSSSSCSLDDWLESDLITDGYSVGMGGGGRGLTIIYRPINYSLAFRALLAVLSEI